MKVSIISTCKGRLQHARQSIPLFLNQEHRGFEYDVIVVDFGCPEETGKLIEISPDWPQKRNTECFVVHAVNNTDYFHLARARNIGGKFAIANGSEILCFADIDHLLPSDWLQEYIGYMERDNLDLLNANFDIREPKLWDLEFFGLACIRRDCFLQLRGFDESMTGWGMDDIDLYYRIREHKNPKYKWSYLPARITLINHSEEDSMRYHKQKTMQESMQQNQKIMQQGWDRIVNPDTWGEV